MLKIKTQLKSGFSIIEIIVALFIISIGMIGVLSLIVQNIQSQNVNKGALIAAQLAQEGIELIRHTRDSNWAAAQAWNTNLAPGHYIIDYRLAAPRAISFSNQEHLRQDATGYYYNPDLSTDLNPDSGYARTIDIVANPGNASSIYVKAAISWSDHNKNFSYVVDTILYDWK